MGDEFPDDSLSVPPPPEYAVGFPAVRFHHALQIRESGGAVEQRELTMDRGLVLAEKTPIRELGRSVFEFVVLCLSVFSLKLIPKQRPKQRCPQMILRSIRSLPRSLEMLHGCILGTVAECLIDRYHQSGAQKMRQAAEVPSAEFPSMEILSKKQFLVGGWI